MNSVFAQYEVLPSPQFAVINLSLRLRLITANFGLDNSSYRSQPHSIIVNCAITFNPTINLRKAQQTTRVVRKLSKRKQAVHQNTI